MPMFDTNMLGYLFRSPDEKALVHDGQTGEVVDQLVTRIAHLVDTLNDTGADIIIPAPAYAELLCSPLGLRGDVFAGLASWRHVRVAPFEQKAAITLAQNYHIWRPSADHTRPRKAISVDLQIIAIAVSLGESVVYSNDGQFIRCAEQCGLVAVSMAGPSPPSPTKTGQLDL